MTIRVDNQRLRPLRGARARANRAGVCGARRRWSASRGLLVCAVLGWIVAGIVGAVAAQPAPVPPSPRVLSGAPAPKAPPSPQDASKLPVPGRTLGPLPGPYRPPPTRPQPYVYVPAQPRLLAPYPPPKPEPVCPPGNLLKGAMMRGHGVTGSTLRARDGQLALEGAAWNDKSAVRLGKANESYLQVDLRSPRTIRGLLVQGDNNDELLIQGSTDGHTFSPLWVAPAVPDVGLRTRYVTLAHAVSARYLRLSARGGDGYYSVAEWSGYCELPTPWPPKLNVPPPKRYWSLLTNPLMVWIQAGVGTAGFALLLIGFGLPYPFRRTLRPRRLRDGALALAGFLALLGAAHTGFWYFTAAAGVLLSVWFLFRWASGATVTPRLLSPLARALCRPPASLLLAALSLAVVAGVTQEKGILFGAGAAFGLWLLWALTRMLRAQVSFRQTARILLMFFGLFGLGSWWNFGHFHFDHFIHIWEQYHYVIGAKYGPELRYGRIYECTAAADLADGLKKQVQERKVRRLATDNELATAQHIIEHPELCTDHFTEDRWASFRRDVRFFRNRFSADRWDKSQTDHGYNATPIWGVAARVISERMGELNWEKVEYLGTIDVVLVLLLWLCAFRTFGMEATCVALLYWGINYPARYYWNGGGFLRYDWLFFLVLGLCALRKQRMFAAAMALTYATGLRVFPGFFVAPLVLKALARMVRERRFVLSRAHIRFAAGCLLTIAALTPLSSWSMDGLDAWGEFAQNSQKHMETALTNNMGLKTVIGYDYPTRAANMRDAKQVDPFQPWKDARAHFYKERKPLLYLLIALYVLLLARAADRSEDWEAACLGAGLSVMAVELTCYYYAFLISYGLLWERRKLPGILLAAYAASTAFMDRIPWNDDRYTAMSLAAVVMVLIVTGHVALGRSRAEKERAASPGLGIPLSPADVDRVPRPAAAAPDQGGSEAAEPEVASHTNAVVEGPELA